MQSLGIDAALVARLRSQGIVTPTSIQRLAVPRILAGESVVVRSQTGSGKTLAYVAPLLQRLSVEGGDSQVLVLLPTRELAQQVGRVVCELSRDVAVAVIYGGVDYEPQREVLAQHPRVIVATPGRLLDLIDQGVADISGVRYFVLDEVDQMVDMGFQEPILELSKYRSDDAQTLCFSATLNALISDVVGDVELVEDSSAPLAAQRIEQSAYFVEQSMMDHLLLHLLRRDNPRRAILFCRSRKMADRLAEMLREAGFSAEAIHSDRSQVAREHIMRRFYESQTTLLVATDLLARGIDVDGVSHVFNFGLPLSPEQYIHRIGRTGRAGESGAAITLLCADEQRVLKQICATMRQRVEVVSNHPYMTPAVTRELSEPQRLKRRQKR